MLLTHSKQQLESFTPPVSQFVPRSQKKNGDVALSGPSTLSPTSLKMRPSIRRPLSFNQTDRLSSSKPPSVPRNVVERAFQEWDRDGDGRISVEDLVHFVNSQKYRASVQLSRGMAVQMVSEAISSTEFSGPAAAGHLPKFSKTLVVQDVISALGFRRKQSTLPQYLSRSRSSTSSSARPSPQGPFSFEAARAKKKEKGPTAKLMDTTRLSNTIAGNYGRPEDEGGEWRPRTFQRQWLLLVEASLPAGEPMLSPPSSDLYKVPVRTFRERTGMDANGRLPWQRLQQQGGTPEATERKGEDGGSDGFWDGMTLHSDFDSEGLSPVTLNTQGRGGLHATYGGKAVIDQATAAADEQPSMAISSATMPRFSPKERHEWTRRSRTTRGSSRASTGTGFVTVAPFRERDTRGNEGRAFEYFLRPSPTAADDWSGGVEEEPTVDFRSVPYVSPDMVGQQQYRSSLIRSRGTSGQVMTRTSFNNNNNNSSGSFSSRSRNNGIKSKDGSSAPPSHEQGGRATRLEGGNGLGDRGRRLRTLTAHKAKECLRAAVMARRPRSRAHGATPEGLAGDFNGSRGLAWEVARKTQQATANGSENGLSSHENAVDRASIVPLSSLGKNEEGAPLKKRSAELQVPTSPIATDAQKGEPSLNSKRAAASLTHSVTFKCDDENTNSRETLKSNSLQLQIPTDKVDDQEEAKASQKAAAAPPSPLHFGFDALRAFGALSECLSDTSEFARRTTAIRHFRQQPDHTAEMRYLTCLRAYAKEQERAAAATSDEEERERGVKTNNHAKDRGATVVAVPPSHRRVPCGSPALIDVAIRMAHRRSYGSGTTPTSVSLDGLWEGDGAGGEGLIGDTDAVQLCGDGNFQRIFSRRSQEEAWRRSAVHRARERHRDNSCGYAYNQVDEAERRARASNAAEHRAEEAEAAEAARVSAVDEATRALRRIATADLAHLRSSGTTAGGKCPQSFGPTDSFARAAAVHQLLRAILSVLGKENESSSSPPPTLPENRGNTGDALVSSTSSSWSATICEFFAWSAGDANGQNDRGNDNNARGGLPILKRLARFDPSSATMEDCRTMDLALASLKKVSATGLVPRAAQLLSEWMRQQRIAVDMINIIVRHGAAASASHIGGGTLPRAKFTSKVPLEVDLVPLKNRVAKNQHGLMGLPKVGLFEKDVEKPYEHEYRTAPQIKMPFKRFEAQLAKARSSLDAKGNAKPSIAEAALLCQDKAAVVPFVCPGK